MQRVSVAPCVHFVSSHSKGAGRVALWLALCLLASCINLVAMQPALAQETAQQADWHYTLRPSDNLQKVAKKVLNQSRTWHDLVRYNGISDPAAVLPGSIIRIPMDWLKQQPKPATILSTSGSVLIKSSRDAQYKVLKPNRRVHVGDEITTRAGTVLIKFADGTLLRLEEQSTLVFNKLSHFGTTGMVDTQLRLKKGSLSTEVTPLTKGSRYEIRTPSAVAAVRGTKFRLEATPDGTKIEVLEGRVEFSHEHGTKMIYEGNGAQIKRGVARIESKELLDAPKPQFSGQAVARLPKTLKWEEPAAADNFKYQLTDENGQRTLRSGEVSDPELELDNLADGEYNVAMHAVDSDGFGGFDSSANFMVDIDRDIPTLLAPSNGTIMDTNRPLFSWKFNFDDTKGSLELARNEDFSNMVLVQDVTSNVSVVLQKELEPGTYFWRIITDTAQPENTVLPINSFSIRGQMKPVKILTVNYIDNQVGLFWNTVIEAKGYILQLSDDRTFESVLKEETLGKNSAHLRLQKGKTYFARVKGISNDQFSSEFGPIKELEIKE